MSQKGHEDLLQPPRLSARYRLGEGTFAGPNDNGRDAPVPAIRVTTIGRLKSTEAVENVSCDVGEVLWSRA